MQAASGFVTSALIHLLEILFVIGAVGSAVVILLSTIEDARTLSNKD